MKKSIVVVCVLVIMAIGLVFIAPRYFGDKSDEITAEKMKRDRRLPEKQGPDTLTVCSFNIQFLGNFKKKDDEALADILKSYDIVVVQELVAPPYDGVYPDSSTYTGDAESAEFFDAMTGNDFEYLLSEEDTGTNETIHSKSASTEWWVAFYKPNHVHVATDLPHGFLAQDRSDHPDFERVPYAFPFRSTNQTLDFVLISVHLQPDDSPSARLRRQHELQSISNWIRINDSLEKDFVILGDMNIYDAEELTAALPPGFISLNDECRTTNTSGTENDGKPYDHVLIRPEFTGNEIDKVFDFKVIDLISIMQPYWTLSEPYPGDPYDHNEFRQYYSDHHPVVFRFITPDQDDDGVKLVL